MASDGTATFSGLVSAATAPTADENLTNKLYVDGLDTVERDARIAADTTLTNDLAAEEAARIAADALKLDLAGGTMSGAIQMGISGEPTVFDSTNSSDATVDSDGLSFTTTYSWAGAYVVDGAAPNTGTYHYKFDANSGNMGWGLSVNRSDVILNADNDVKVYPALSKVYFGGSESDVSHSGVDFSSSQTKELIYNSDTGEITFISGGNSFATITVTPQTYYFTVFGNASGTSATLDPTSGKLGGSGSTIGIDGTATFGDNIFAATAPTSGDHLTNKTYVDGLDSTITSALAAETAARIAADNAEEAARIAADATLTTNLAQEVADRMAADALKLDLAGGTMTGALEMGGTQDTPYVSNIATYGEMAGSPQDLTQVFDSAEQTQVGYFRFTNGEGAGVEFNPLTVTTSLRVHVYAESPSEIVLNKTIETGISQNTIPWSGRWVDVTAELPSLPFDLTAIGFVSPTFNTTTNVGGIESMLPQNVQGQPVTDVYGDTYQQVFNDNQGNTGYTFTSGTPLPAVSQQTQGGVNYGTGRGGTSSNQMTGGGIVINPTVQPPQMTAAQQQYMEDYDK